MNDEFFNTSDEFIDYYNINEIFKYDNYNSTNEKQDLIEKIKNLEKKNKELIYENLHLRSKIELKERELKTIYKHVQIFDNSNRMLRNQLEKAYNDMQEVKKELINSKKKFRIKISAKDRDYPTTSSF